MYEHRSAPVISWRAFVRRMLRHGGYVAEIAAASIALGMLGFHFLAMEGWVDSFLNSTMLLGGMGPVGEIRSTAGKIFAGVFALYAGLVFIAAFALLTAPALHRLLHKHNAEKR
jgi:hypothetical protein